MAVIRKWGNSLAIRIPAAVADQVRMSAGTEVELSVQNGSIVVTPKTRPKYSLRELLKGCKPDNFHGEVDWGPDVGREALD